jgi:hypothetical protein
LKISITFWKYGKNILIIFKAMKSILSLEQVHLSIPWLIVKTNGREYKFNIRDLSPRLAVATEEELKDFEVSPSGYGIHWEKIDEDISLTALLETRPV